MPFAHENDSEVELFIPNTWLGKDARSKATSQNLSNYVEKLSDEDSFYVIRENLTDI